MHSCWSILYFVLIAFVLNLFVFKILFRKGFGKMFWKRNQKKKKNKGERPWKTRPGLSPACAPALPPQPSLPLVPFSLARPNWRPRARPAARPFSLLSLFRWQSEPTRQRVPSSSSFQNRAGLPSQPRRTIPGTRDFFASVCAKLPIKALRPRRDLLFAGHTPSETLAAPVLEFWISSEKTSAAARSFLPSGLLRP